MGSEESLLNRMDRELENLAQLFLQFPSFKTLLDEEKYYEADRFVRQETVRVLKESKPALNKLIQRLGEDVQQGHHIQAVVRVETKLDTLMNRVAHAEFADKRTFSKIKLQSTDLQRLLTFDSQLLHLVTHTSSAIAGLVDVSIHNLDAACGELEQHLTLMEQALAERKNILAGV